MFPSGSIFQPAMLVDSREYDQQSRWVDTVDVHESIESALLKRG